MLFLAASEDDAVRQDARNHVIVRQAMTAIEHQSEVGHATWESSPRLLKRLSLLT